LRADGAGGNDHGVFWRGRRSPLTERDVDDLFHALWEIRQDAQQILAILRDEEDEDNES
jgi:hypothetical protein